MWVILLNGRGKKKRIERRRYFFIVNSNKRLFLNDINVLYQILWAFSLYLEAVAIMPQLFLLQRTGEVENLTSHYIFTLGGYRAFYLLNWIYRYDFKKYWGAQVKAEQIALSLGILTNGRNLLIHYCRLFTEPGYRQWLVWLSGTAQTALFCDFFYYYLTRYNSHFIRFFFMRS